jgi:hypothetical protein
MDLGSDFKIETSWLNANPEMDLSAINSNIVSMIDESDMMVGMDRGLLTINEIVRARTLRTTSMSPVDPFGPDF